MNPIAHNRKISRAVSACGVGLVCAAKTKADMLKILAPALALPSLEFSAAPPVIALACAAGCCMAAHDLGQDFLWIYWLCAAFLVVVLIPHFLRITRRDTLVKNAILRAAMIDNGMAFKHSYVPSALACALADTFSSFTLGDKGREIESFARGAMSVDGGEFEFRAYTFKYIIVRRSTDSKGRVKKTEHTYRHYCLHLPNFKYAPNMEVQSPYGRTWTRRRPRHWRTEFDAFNKKYRVSCEDETACARFLSPAVLLAFESAGKRLEDLSMEANGGEVLFSMKRADALYIPKDLTRIARNTASFRDAILEDLEFPNLKILKNLILKMKEFNDSNF